ncbi:MAG TPA: histidinol-phosphatase [Verrucomicrobia bacterium]|nr:histidinol-phosphatase [Verrucomicrobiota bacterium]
MSSMNSIIDKQFPRGAEWVRADFHLHTKVDREFKYSGEETFYNSAYVDALEKADIRLGIITNHNKFDFEEFKSLRGTARKKKIGLLPGVELSVNDGKNGIHMLVVFSDSWFENGQDHINPFLTVAFEGKTPAQYEQENGRSSLSLLDTIKKLEGYHKDFFLVFAHVEQPSGLWIELDGGRMIDLGENEFFRQRTLGFQKVRTHDGAGKGNPCRVLVKQWLNSWYPAEVEGSDPKAIEEIGKSKPSYLKLGELSFEATKFALFDHAHRVRSALPEPRQAVLLRQVRFNGGALDGIAVPFSPSLNCLIGPRGNGKSAVIECLRHALGFREVSDERYKSGLVERMLSPAGKVVVEAVDEYGREVRVERERTGQPEVYLDGTYRDISPGSILKDILYFGQKDLSTRSEAFDESFLDKLLADRLDPKPQEEAALIEGVRQAARQLKETLEATEKIAALQKEKNELDAQLQVFADKGVDKKLAEMTLFDGDRLAVIAWQQALKELGTNIKESADWDEADEAFPMLKSKRTAPISTDLMAAKAKSDQARESTQAALQSLREVFASVGEALHALAPVQEEMKQEVAQLQKTLNEPQLDLDLFRKKKARLDQLVKLLAAGAQRSKTEQTARDLLGAAVNKLHDFWRERFTEREAEVRRLEGELPLEIRLQTEFKGKRRAFGEFLRSKFRGSGLQGPSYETMETEFVDGRELYQGRAELETHLSESAAVKVRSTLLEHLSDFLSFRTPDETVILFHQKPLGGYSLGQRATVILHILMHLQRHPVILIDQPEDDLDNETLYSHFIRQLLERKELTQFVFATHNPNIPVLGDAEQAIVCRKEGETFSFDHGSIDDKEIQQRIVTVMEGGEDAFRRRKEIYQLWKNLN